MEITKEHKKLYEIAKLKQGLEKRGLLDSGIGTKLDVEKQQIKANSVVKPKGK